MEPETEVMRIGTQYPNLDALATVLGVCLLIIILCAFTGMVLLFQHLQRSRECSESVPVIAVPRRTPKPTVATSQFRPLGEGLRHRGDVARPLSGVFERSSSLLASSDAILPGTVPVDATSVAVVRSLAEPNHPAIDGSARLPQKQVTSNEVFSAPDGSQIKSAAKPIDEIDIELLSRIDEALSSGHMRPQQATELFKSYGCDLDDLLKTELEGSSSVEGSDSTASRFASAPVLGMRGIAPCSPAATNMALIMSAPTTKASALAPGPGPATPPRLSGPAQSNSPECTVSMCTASPQHFRQPSGSHKQPDQALRCVGSAGSMLTSSLLSTSGGAVGGGAVTGGTALSSGGAVIDDALLLKIDMALASGCVRPDQATQLLKSYGCDLEELLREELGDTAPDPIRKASSGLSL